MKSSYKKISPYLLPVMFIALVGFLGGCQKQNSPSSKKANTNQVNFVRFTPSQAR